jgi:ABC-type multidrug transport system ATPase subunit
MPESPILELKQINKSYRNKNVLKDCSLELAAGEAVCIEGHNGSGKSTLLALVMGYEKANSGIIRTPALGHGLSGYINKPVFFAHLSGRQNIDLFMDMRGQDYDRAACETMLSTLGLTGKHKRASTYSTGMLKKYGIVRSLLCKPEVLVLDEPFSGVDQSGVEALHGLLLDAIRENNMSLLFTNHEAKALEGFPHQKMILANGQLRAVKADSKKAGQAHFKLNTVDACNVAAQKVEACLGHPPSVDAALHTLVTDCYLGEYQKLLGLLQDEQLVGCGWQREEENTP